MALRKTVALAAARGKLPFHNAESDSEFGLQQSAMPPACVFPVSLLLCSVSNHENPSLPARIAELGSRANRL
jgi:hypothetical protein